MVLLSAVAKMVGTIHPRLRMRTSEDAPGSMDFFFVYMYICICVCVYIFFVYFLYKKSVTLFHRLNRVFLFVCLFFNFCLTHFKGLRTEGVTTTQIIKLSKKNDVL